jgi:hypothetical protein
MQLIKLECADKVLSKCCYLYRNVEVSILNNISVKTRLKLKCLM